MPMEDYKKMYFELFNKITDAIETLKKTNRKQKKNLSLPTMM